MKIIGSEIIEMETINSTNEFAINFCKENRAINGTIIYSKEQTAGKGQDGNFWESESGKNLSISIILKPMFLEASMCYLLNKTIALGVADFIKEKLPSLQDLVKIKWPNDIYIQNKKVAGILIHNSFFGNDFSESIVGIGININQTFFASNAPNPVSLIQMSNLNYDIKICLEELSHFLEKRYRLLCDTKFESINEAYRLDLYRLNVWSYFIVNNQKIYAKILGVSEFGKLIIEQKSKEIIEFDLKEISFII
jgi:BirA family biotin operon repressor/biotin-[acetyl-CoA-carboxylase] ligase